ncbi:MAG: hypothetical protein K9G26_07455 [Emcibacter sp.]|nr:hypothetical protein [Emcibacter sp.]
MTSDKISQLIIQIAEQYILPRFNGLKQSEITEKAKGEMVTIADIEAEKNLTSGLKDIFPMTFVCGEESISQNAELMPKIINAAFAADRAFLIDPVDGTNNFIKGDEKFAVMVTELRRGEVSRAWIYLPISQKMAVAEKGAGAWLNDQNIKIKPHDFIPSEMIAAAHIGRFPVHLKSDAKHNLHQFKQNKPAYCAGYDYISLGRGEKNFSAYYRTLPWDHLPGSLFFSEAGGYVRSLLDQEEYGIHDQYKGLLSANSEEHWIKIKEILFPNYN